MTKNSLVADVTFNLSRSLSLSLSLSLVQSLQIKAGKYSAGIYMWHRFGNGKKSWWDSNQNKWLSRSSRSKGFYKNGVLRIFLNFTRRHLCGTLLFDKVRHCRSAASFNRDFSTGSFHEFFKICKVCFNSSEGEFGTRNCKIYNRN